MELIDGKMISTKIKEDLKEKISVQIDKGNRAPKLTVILVGDDPASMSYVKGKNKASVEVGIINDTVYLDKDIKEEELLDLIDKLNLDDTVDGILVQLPLPKHINEDNVLERIKVEKDVDGFHPLNVAKLFMKKKCVIPCTPKGVMRLLSEYNIKPDGLNAVVVGRSQIVGLPLSKLLLDANASVTTVHSHTKGIKDICKKADILCVAIGKAKYITKDYVKEGAVVIDIGVNRVEGSNKLCGDCDFDDLKDHVSYINKVPGGVGPMTIACLLENTYTLYLNHLK